MTGIGLVTPLGTGVKTVWDNLVQSRSGIVRLGNEYNGIPSKIAGCVPTGTSSEDGAFVVDNFVSKSDLRSMSMATAYALAATEEALSDARWHPKSDSDCRSTGVAIGNAMADLDYIIDSGLAFREKGYSRLSPYFVPKILTNMASGHISIRYRLRGPNHSVATACTTGLHAVGDAFSFIRRGYAEVMVSGGTECSVSPICLAAFSRMRALSTTVDPTKASRPFDKHRDGFVVAEGAGILVLESLDHALNRGAQIYAEILGYGLSADAIHITASCSDGEGAMACMQAALASAGLEPSQVGYVNAHATSTPIGDTAEATAIQRVFRNCSRNPAVSSTKGATGHLLGAAGAVETAFTVLACHTGLIPPTLNLENADVEANLDFVALKPRTWKEPTSRRIALKNSFGFGGTNGSLVIAEYKNN